MVKNEANFIGHVVAPLMAKLGDVMVFDTGSEDETIEICRGLGATVICKGESIVEQIGAYRTEMNQIVKTGWSMICDGDELYSTEMLDEIAEYDIPDGKIMGFTTMISVDFVDGRYVLVDDLFNRLAFHPRGTVYRGDYPFESPVPFADPGNYFYVPTNHTAYHLHRLVRSPMDDRVQKRKEKQFLYSMQEANLPVIGPVILPLNPRFPDVYANMSATSAHN